MKVGHRVYGAAAILFGLVGLVFGDFAAVWQPVPDALPDRRLLAYAVAAALLVAGAAIQWRRTAAWGSLALTALYGLGVVLLHVPRIVAHPTDLSAWAGGAEQLALVAGGLMAWAGAAKLDARLAARLARLAQLAFGVSLIAFGAVHFAFLKETAAWVPKWLPPGQAFWAFATGAAHLAAAVAILSGVLARPAAWLLTAMFIVFGLLVHAPMLAAAPHDHFEWAANAMNLALVGAAWIMADSLRGRAPH